MRIKLEIKDRDSYVSKEAIQNLKSRYGVDCSVQALPDSDTPESFIKFAIQELISEQQLEYFFEYNDRGYENKMQNLRSFVHNLVDELFDQVTQENEKRLE